jgi:AraC-like DNA-binding protein
VTFFKIRPIVAGAQVFAGVAHAKKGYVHDERKNLFLPEIFIVEKGTLFIEGNGKKHALVRGSVLFQQDGIHQKGYYASPENCSFIWIHFKGPIPSESLTERKMSVVREQLTGVGTAVLGDQAIYVPEYFKPRFFGEIVKLGLELAERKPRLPQEPALLINMLLCRCSADFFMQSAGLKISPELRRTEDIKYWIEKHVHEPVSASDIARQLGMNCDYLGRMFKQNIGVTIGDYIALRKIELARESLKKGASVKATSYDCGYRDAKYFDRVFKKLMGMSPTEYRSMTGHLQRN